MALRPSGKSLSIELWILLASWHATLRNFVASTMRTCLRLRLGEGVVGSVLVAAPDSVHSTCIELQLSLATSSYPHPS